MRSRYLWSAIALTIAAGFAPAHAQESAPKPEKRGVLLNATRALPGYNLINPSGKKTYLFDNEGRVVHTWTSEYGSSVVSYLLDNGHLFRVAEAPNRAKGFQGPAAGGRLQEFDWDGNLVWDFEYHSAKRLPHHDAIKLPNGNALLICWEWIDENEAVAQGRRPETVKDSHLQPDCLVEIRPTGKTTGEVVWEWRTWDHLIQDRDRNRPNYGKVSEHPERIDVNYMEGDDDDATKKDQDRRPRREPDWMHVNAVAYNAELDQVVVSSPHFCEIWIIDHGTTTEEARGHTGGRRGKGGDLLYRWGNPRAYRNGTKADRRLFYQHNIHWIPRGLSGEGHLLVFNNGDGRSPVAYSSVDEFVPPTDPDGRYLRDEHGRFGPAEALWSYSAPDKKDFFSSYISGAQRLPNGNTLINEGAYGLVFEVTPEKETVWKFSNPIKNVPPPRPAPPRLFEALPRFARAALGLKDDQRTRPAPPKPFEALPRFARDALSLKDDQRKKLDAIDAALIAKLEALLDADQKKALTEPSIPEMGTAPAGEYLPSLARDALKLTDAQKTEMEALRKEFNPKIAAVFTDDQKRTIADLKKNLPAPRPAGPRRTGNSLFRANRYPLDHPAFVGKTLEPRKTLVEVQEELDRPH
jgi:hypothetical protein